MAAAVLVGVGPAHGLHACVAGPIAGGSRSDISRDSIACGVADIVLRGSSSWWRCPPWPAALVFAAIASLRPRRLLTVLRTGRSSRIATTTTFSATLLVPVAEAIGVGVALSLLPQLDRRRSTSPWCGSCRARTGGSSNGPRPRRRPGTA